MEKEKHTAVKTVTIEKAAAMLNKSAHSVRQLLARGKLGRVRMGYNVLVNLDEVLHYYADKKNMASWEDNVENLKNKSFVSVDFASAALMVQPGYIHNLIQKKSLEGYITYSGDIMIAKESISTYLGAIDHDKHTL